VISYFSFHPKSCKVTYKTVWDLLKVTFVTYNVELINVWLNLYHLLMKLIKVLLFVKLIKGTESVCDKLQCCIVNFNQILSCLLLSQFLQLSLRLIFELLKLLVVYFTLSRKYLILSWKVINYLQLGYQLHLHLLFCDLQIFRIGFLFNRLMGIHLVTIYGSGSVVTYLVIKNLYLLLNFW
jgi:hypothetical protein